MRALVLLSLLFTVCVSAGLVDLKNSAESIKGLIKERVVDKIKNTAHRIKELVKRRSTDKVQPMGDSIEEVNLQNHIAGALFQGDMVLTKEQEDQIIDDITNDGTRARRQALRDPKYPGMRWHEGVKYFFDSSASPQVKSVFKKAAAQWMADTCIDFKEVPNQEESAEDSIRVYMEDGCWSYVGRLGGIQNLSLGKGCE
ncbi:astacin, partial [Ostertagia ostertagi]